ncbi:amidohydrolase family protein [Asaia astilbis]|uniref:amidohydrolase family protein n=1 Tax=Asaia astilbis TaxID=610244 RepID=UPI000472E909|nr:amidohydrolase family protein [Asaia astilbis]
MEQIELIDHHCHAVTNQDLDRATFESLMSEGDRAVPGCTQFDKPLGLMMGKWCAPVLGLAPHADPDSYLSARKALGAREVARRLAGQTGVNLMLIDTGFLAERLYDCNEMKAVTGIQTKEVIRIEALMEEVARSGITSGRELALAFVETLGARSAFASGLKSIVAYRTSFDIPQSRPSETEVFLAADEWLRQLADGTSKRLEDVTLVRFALWEAGELCRKHKFPLQLHVGIGDRDIFMPKCDPTVFAPFIKDMEDWGVSITLLHCYPFIREAAWLSEVFSNVYMDIGVMQSFAGPFAKKIIGEAMEITPFYKQLYSSDAFGLAEMHYLGAALFRKGMAEVLNGWISTGDVTANKAEQIATAICSGNAKRIYNL